LYYLKAIVQGRSQGEGAEVSGHPLGQKIPGEDYRAEKLFAKAKHFSRWRAPPLAYFWLRHWSEYKISLGSGKISREYEIFKI